MGRGHDCEICQRVQIGINLMVHKNTSIMRVSKVKNGKL